MIEPLKSLISKTIAADSRWRIVTAEPTLVRAIPTELRYLHRILTEIIFQKMKNLKVILCLGNDSCKIVGTVINDSGLASEFDGLRRDAEPVKFEGKLVFAAWHPVASESGESVRRVWESAAAALAGERH